MKQLIVLILIMVLAVQGASALVTGGSGLDISLLNYEPVPVQPGDIMDIWLLVENDGSKGVADVTVEIVDSFPFFTDNENERIKRISTVPAQESFLVKSKVRVDKNANIGTNFLRVLVRQGDSGTTFDSDLEITIQGESSTLTIDNAVFTPRIVPPGSEGNVQVTVRNVGDQRLRNIIVEFDVTGLSLVPGSGSDSSSLDILQGGQTHTFNFNFIVMPDAAPNAYRVPVNLTYVDEDGNEQSQDEAIGLVISSEPELLVYFEQISLSKESMQGEVVIKFINKGLSEIKLLEMEVLEDEHVEVTSESPLIYVGNIDEDDFDTTSVHLKIDESPATVQLRVAYKDALNKPYEEMISLELDATNGNGNGGTNWFLWIVIIIVIAGGIWWWRKKKSKKGRK